MHVIERPFIPPPMAASIKKAPLGARFCAAFLDGAIIALIAAPTLLWSVYAWLIFLSLYTVLYYGACEGGPMAATLGKMICGLTVVTPAGQKPGFGRGFLRAVSRLLSHLILNAGFVTALFDDQGRTIHDRLAKTSVTVYEADALGYAPAGQYQRITGLSGYHAGHSFQISRHGIIIGRDSAACDVVFPESALGVSRRHCMLRVDPSVGVILMDLGSSFGTYLSGGTALTRGEAVVLRPGQGFYLAAETYMFRVG